MSSFSLFPQTSSDPQTQHRPSDCHVQHEAGRVLQRKPFRSLTFVLGDICCGRGCWGKMDLPLNVFSCWSSFSLLLSFSLFSFWKAQYQAEAFYVYVKLFGKTGIKCKILPLRAYTVDCLFSLLLRQRRAFIYKKS